MVQSGLWSKGCWDSQECMSGCGQSGVKGGGERKLVVRDVVKMVLGWSRV